MIEAQAELSMAQRLVLAWELRDRLWGSMYNGWNEVAASKYNLDTGLIRSVNEGSGYYTVKQAEKVIAEFVYNMLGGE